ncbi:MAG TPA: Ni-sirohydrochlorin a,c-diamide reductive cyclase ATP-dependent reductase subunit [Methanosphaera sp.]|nr:Ni-sirohydrochlorin a,c-diamide reductive cyclase ATP-dependent reductase subunit [Methanosphaera sp.]HII09294.1 Ni-sirohydrochlorin a,c-diamide reductive cyclase ATP-dependent reductase subunit [Methanosphaera sp.]HIJ15821.1 Ni-sirohydrochlorin a,c-diamide reductive cyclase ATP-dependent reductase subunit [Methanosphaera sp.]
MVKKIAVYGKGGIGKSTTVSNMAAAYDNDTFVIGCDPKSDTTRTLVGKRIPTILDTIKKNKEPLFEDVVYEGYNNTLCVEAGGPEPGVGCAGRGVIVAMKLLDQISAFKSNPELVIYDVLGDVVCGGFSVPLREEYADEVYIVTSGEYMSLYAANNIAKGVRKLNGKLGGIICNCRNVKDEIEIVTEFASLISSKVISIIPRSDLVQKSEYNACTVLEMFPESEQSDVYRDLVKNIVNNDSFTNPTPMSTEEFETFFHKYV